MKRFSKIVSRTVEVPCAMHMSAMSCACRSVGKPGKGSVSTATGMKAAAVPRHSEAGRHLFDLDAARAQKVEGASPEDRRGCFAGQRRHRSWPLPWRRCRSQCGRAMTVCSAP